MAQRGLWNIAIKRMFEDRGASSREDGNLLRECQAKVKKKTFLAVGCARMWKVKKKKGRS